MAWPADGYEVIMDKSRIAKAYLGLWFWVDFVRALARRRSYRAAARLPATAPQLQRVPMSTVREHCCS